MQGQHHYKISVNWTGNTGSGTSSYRAYSRNHIVSVNNKEGILCSSDPSFRGDPSRYNPEELLVAALSSCHMLWYLHLCAVNNIVVKGYRDNAEGTMKENADGSGDFTEVILYPVVTVADESMLEKAAALHQEANKLCFIARSLKFPVHHQPTVKVLNDD